jgi:nicotinate-nucleotide adenylyltransferase
MLRQVLIGTPYTIEEAELERDGPSFTVATLEILSKREPEAGWILVMGSDQAANFVQWYSAGRILEVASIAVAHRPDKMGVPKTVLPSLLLERVKQSWSGGPGEVILLPSTDLELSSSNIRRQLAIGQDPIGLAPQVKNAIVQNGAYR